MRLCNLTLPNVSVSCNSTQSRRQSVKIKRLPVLLEISLPGDSLSALWTAQRQSTDLP